MFRDGLGQEIRKDDVVAFGKRDGNQGSLVVARVAGISFKEKFDGGYWIVKLQSWCSYERRWKQARVVNEQNFVKIPFTVEQIESLPSSGLV